MSRLETVFFNTAQEWEIKKYKINKKIKKVGETKFIAFMTALKQLYSTVSVYGKLACGGQVFQSGLKSVKANRNPFQRPKYTSVVQ